MRYIIIPLGIILYIWWTIKFVRIIKKYNSDIPWYKNEIFEEGNEFSLAWVVSHIVILFIVLSLLTLIYW